MELHGNNPQRRGRRVPLFATAAVALLGLIGAQTLLASPTASAVTKKKAPAKAKPAVAGGTCSPVGARAPGTSLDCVKVGTKLQWQPKGSKLNPYLVGESFAWTQSSNLQNPGALISSRTISVVEYLPDASGWVSMWPDNQPQDIFNAAKGDAVRGVRVKYKLVSATDVSSRNLGSLTTLWLGDDRTAGCCTQGTLQWGVRPAEAIDAYTSLADGEEQTGMIIFARPDEALGSRPLMRLSWNDVGTGRIAAVFFDVIPR
jgi:hypothetical protein